MRLCFAYLRYFVHWNCCVEDMPLRLALLEFARMLARKLRFLYLQLLEFEGSLARKLRFPYLQLLEFERSIARKLCLQWNCGIQRMCSTVVCCHSCVFCNSASADRSGMASSKFLVAAAACVMILCFAAESRTSH